jgi:hypothetical protein
VVVVVGVHSTTVMRHHHPPPRARGEGIAAGEQAPGREVVVVGTGVERERERGDKKSLGE